MIMIIVMMMMIVLCLSVCDCVCVCGEARPQTNGVPCAGAVNLNHVSIDFLQIECPFIHNAFPS